MKQPITTKCDYRNMLGFYEGKATLINIINIQLCWVNFTFEMTFTVCLNFHVCLVNNAV
jgi:hypothetical protein